MTLSFSLCHMYEVTDLHDLCAEYLEKNIADDNVVDIWAVAETTRNEKLKRKALEYLGKKEKMMMEIPRLNETFQDPQLMASLVNYMSARMTLSAAGKEEAMTVKVVCFAASGELVFTAAISVKPTDTVGILRALTNSALSNCGQGDWECDGYFYMLPGSKNLAESETLKAYSIKDEATVFCFVKL